MQDRESLVVKSDPQVPRWQVVLQQFNFTRVHNSFANLAFLFFSHPPDRNQQRLEELLRSLDGADLASLKEKVLIPTVCMAATSFLQHALAFV